MKQNILIITLSLLMQLPTWAATGTGEGEKTGDKKTEKEAAVTNTSSAFT